MPIGSEQKEFIIIHLDVKQVLFIHNVGVKSLSKRDPKNNNEVTTI